MAEYLERESILNAIRKTSNLYVDQQGLYLSCELIAAMPAADVQPIRHGRWIAENRDKRGYADCYTCSNCNNYTYMYTLMKDCEHEYCPNCGARMDGEQNETNFCPVLNDFCYEGNDACKNCLALKEFKEYCDRRPKE